MRTSLIVGMALAILGVAVFVVGLDSAQTPAEQVRETLTGHYSNATMMWLGSGAVLFLVGCVIAARGAWRR